MDYMPVGQAPYWLRIGSAGTAHLPITSNPPSTTSGRQTTIPDVILWVGEAEDGMESFASLSFPFSSAFALSHGQQMAQLAAEIDEIRPAHYELCEEGSGAVVCRGPLVEIVAYICARIAHLIERHNKLVEKHRLDAELTASSNAAAIALKVVGSLNEFIFFPSRDLETPYWGVTEIRIEEERIYSSIVVKSGVEGFAVREVLLPGVTKDLVSGIKGALGTSITPREIVNGVNSAIRVAEIMTLRGVFTAGVADLGKSLFGDGKIAIRHICDFEGVPKTLSGQTVDPGEFLKMFDE